MHSVFNPASPEARSVTLLWWWMLGVGAVIWLGVAALAVYAANARRGERESDGLTHLTPRTHTRVERVVSSGVFATILILAGFLVYDFSVGHALARHPASGALVIDVVGHQWWWEVHYENPDPSRRLTTANEIHVPTGVPVELVLRAADVIHSFWAPNLNGKRDLIPGYTSTLWFRADTAGVYRGQCAEFCGLEHAKMAFAIVAEPPAAFRAWLAASMATPPPPTDSTLRAGEQLFMASGCALCHAIAGTGARGTVGPDLTHVGSRRMIAAGTLPNTLGNLEGWIGNPQALKPGVLMPAPEAFVGDDLRAVAAYLQSLK